MNLWSSILGFFSGYMGKALVFAGIVLAFGVMKLRLDTAQAQLEKSRLEAFVLQNANQKQQAAIKTLLDNHQKQNRLLSEYEQEKRQTEQNLAAVKERLRVMNDNESSVWKKQSLPQGIKTLLQKE